MWKGNTLGCNTFQATPSNQRFPRPTVVAAAALSPILEGPLRMSRTAWRPGKLVSARITPLRLEAFEQLPKHARQCVFWEVDPDAVGRDDHLADPEFEKEAWLSMVMLEWGSCGQVAIAAPAVPGEQGDEISAEHACLGYVLYAPPHAVPRALRFPTGPVSADAVLLTSMGVEPGRRLRGCHTA